MARNGIQFEDVQRAIETLQQRGDAPTIQRIRDILGTGSFTTISDHLREWRTRHEQRTDIPLQSAVPERLQESLMNIWQQAQEEAYEGLEHYRQQANDAITAAEHQAQQALRQSEDVQQRLAALNERLDHTMGRLEEKTSTLAHVESELTQAQTAIEERDHRLQTRDSQIETLTADRDRMEHDHQAALAQNDEHFRKQLAQEEQRHETAEQRLMQLLDAARHEKQEQEKLSRRRLEQLEERLDRMTAQVEEKRRALQDKERHHRDLSLQAQQTAQMLTDTRAQLERAIKTSSERDKEITRLRTELRVLQERMARSSVPPFMY